MGERRRSKSPRRDVRDVKFADEKGQPLAREVPGGGGANSSGHFKDLRTRFPRKDGESRSHWKSRMVTQAKSQP